MRKTNGNTTGKLMPRFITIKDVMEAMKLSRSTVEKLIEEGELEAKKVRRTVRITKASFDRFVANL